MIYDSILVRNEGSTFSGAVKRGGQGPDRGCVFLHCERGHQLVVLAIDIGHVLIDLPWWHMAQTDDIWHMTKEIIMKFLLNFWKFYLELPVGFENE